MISAGFRAASPRRPRTGHSGVYFHHYKGRGARQVIANGNAVRRRDRNPSDLHDFTVTHGDRHATVSSFASTRDPRPQDYQYHHYRKEENSQHAD
jgi:hypothetical protein